MNEFMPRVITASVVCVLWRDCVIMSLVSIIGKPFPHPLLLSSLIAKDGNHCSWSNRCLFSQSTSWDKHQIHSPSQHFLISLWYQVVTFHISISKARLSNSVLITVTSHECHVASRSVMKCHAEINPRERQAWLVLMSSSNDC